MKLTLEDMRSLNYCSRGARLFADRHKLNWSKFVTEGLDLVDVEHIDDAMMKAAVERAKQRCAKKGG